MAAWHRQGQPNQEKIIILSQCVLSHFSCNLSISVTCGAIWSVGWAPNIECERPSILCTFYGWDIYKDCKPISIVHFMVNMYSGQSSWFNFFYLWMKENLTALNLEILPFHSIILFGSLILKFLLITEKLDMKHWLTENW